KKPSQGRRLIDIYIEQGDTLKQNKEYQAAINKYRLALKIDPKYAKAINKINNCQSILQRLKKINPIIAPDPDNIKPPPYKNNLLIGREELDQENFFNFKSDVDACKKITISIARRQGKSKFRQELLEAYSSKCAKLLALMQRKHLKLLI
ncbi:MAG: hypothetical protein ACRAVC_21055, partial [Trichormus sp.]